MTRSVFDPDGGETERSGSSNLGPDAQNISHLPPDVVDGKVEEDIVDDSEDADPRGHVASTTDEAVANLEAMDDEEAEGIDPDEDAT